MKRIDLLMLGALTVLANAVAAPSENMIDYGLKDYVCANYQIMIA